MHILVDSQPYTPTGSPQQTVRDLAREICQTTSGVQERMVVSVRCDGQTVPDRELEGVLKAPASSFGQLEIETQPVAALVRVTLDETIAAFNGFAGLGERAADLLDEGRQDQAMHELQKLCELFKQSQQALVFAAQALGLDLDQVRVDDRPLAEILELVKEPLLQLKQAMADSDLVLVGDTLRYGLDEPAGQWLALLRYLRDQTTRTNPD